MVIWLCIAISIVIVGGATLVLKHYPPKYIFGMVIISELVDYILVVRILGIWHMARLVWIITSEMGSASSEVYIYPVSSLKTDELHSIDLRMRTLPSLIYSANVLLQEQRTLTNEIESYKKQIQKNIEIISSIGNQRTDEKERIIYSKQDENVHLRNAIDQEIKKFAGKKKEYENAKSLISALKEWLIPIFREKWNGSYNYLQVSENALDNVVCSFSVGDVIGIEKRFCEIDNTSNPQAIAKKKSGMYCLELITVQGGVANIIFGAKDKNGHVCIKNVFREEKLIEPFVTNDELAEAIKD
ncbi:MAG: hypothetical protein MR384_01565 [Lachnospiraceae bacterium]|nr:hypothetical protein [Lachnospiraceae bacterium]